MKFWDSADWEKAQRFLETRKDTIVPERRLIFRPLIETPLEKVRVVMVTREPHNGLFNDPDGLAYSCSEPVERIRHLPDELVALFTDLKNSDRDGNLHMAYKVRDFKHGNLKKWAKQGVLLINTMWTTNRAAYGPTHLGVWTSLTMEVLETAYLQNPGTVFVFDSSVPTIYRGGLPRDSMQIVHPTTTLQSFKGFRLFEKINQKLVNSDQAPIDWNV